MTLLIDSRQEQSEATGALETVRAILLQEFGNLHPYDQEYLLRVFWDQMRNPTLVPAIKGMLENNQGRRGQGVRTTALKRLIELTPDEALPFVVAEIRDPVSLADFEVLQSLSEAVLPETDAALLQQIRERAPLRQSADNLYLRHKAALAARYATAAIYQGLLETYQTWGAKWPADARASLLGYFARHNAKQAMPLIEQALAESGPGSEFSFLGDLTRGYYSEALDALLKKRLESKDPQVVSTAAYLMSQHGSREDKNAIEARLDRWVKEWSGRSTELDSAGADTRLVMQRMVQVNLIQALIHAKAWKLAEWQVKELRQSCITQTCRQHFNMK